MKTFEQPVGARALVVDHEFLRSKTCSADTLLETVGLVLES